MDINVEFSMECPFNHIAGGWTSDAGTWWPGDEMCSLGGNECAGFMNKHCPLRTGTIRINPIRKEK